MTFAATSSVTAKGPGGNGGVPCRPVHHALGGRSARNFAHNARGSKSNQFKSIVSATDHSGSAFAALLPVEVAYLDGGSVLPTESPSFFFKTQYLAHEAILSRLMSGPGDSEGAMHKAERIFGLSYWCQFNLRHKRRASLPFMAKIHAAYVSVLERSVRRDLEALKTEREKDNDDAELAGLVAQAEALLAEIAARKSKQNGG